MRDKKKLLALLLFLIMGFFMFTFANPSDTVGTLTKPVEDPKGGETDKKDDDKVKEEVVIVVDNAPVITIEPTTVSIAYGTDYDVMTGVKVTDDKDNLVATPSIKDTKELEVGTYTITYTVTDRAGNTVTATRTLVVFADKNNNNIDDETEDHFDVNFDVEGRGKLEGTTNYAEILTGLTFEEAGIDIPEAIADEYYKLIEWTPVTPTSETVVEETVTYVAVFGPINDVNENGIADEEETYTVTFVDYDGRVIASTPVLVNEDAELPSNPVRAKKNGISYTFNGWDGNYTNVTKNETVTATYVISEIEATVYELKDEYEIPTVYPYYAGSTKKYNKLGTVKLVLTEELVNATVANKATVVAYTEENVLPYVAGELPTLTGYTYNWYVVKYETDGWHIDGKKTINEHTLTVEFNYSRGEEASETVVETVKYNEEYEVEVPVIEYYTPSINVIKGNMPDEDVNIEVVYTPNNDRNENGVADELDPHYTVTFIVRGPGKFASIKRLEDYVARESNDITYEMSEDQKTIVYASILEGLTYAEWENSEDGQSYICATQGEINAKTNGRWLDAEGKAYNNLAKVYSNNTYYMDYFFDRNNNNIDDEKEEKYSVTFEFTGREGIGYFNAKRVEEAANAGATIATSTKIVYEGIVKGATLNKYGYVVPGMSSQGGKCSAFNPVINANNTAITSNVVSSSNCIIDNNNNNIDDENEERFTVTFRIAKNGKFNANAQTAATKAGATTVTDTEIVYSNILTGTTLGNNGILAAPATSSAVANVKRGEWSPAFDKNVKVTEDTVYTISYFYDANNNGQDDDNEMFTVTFVDENENVIGEPQTIKLGEDAVAPEYTKEDTAEFHYTVAWDKEFTNVMSDLTVKAVVTSETRSYEVTFVDYDGSQIGDVQTVKYGEAAIAPENPTRDNYTFTGWDKEFTSISGTTEVKATYTANVVGLTISEIPGAQFEFQVSDDNDDTVIRELLVVKKVYADGSEEETTTYTTDFDRTTAGNKTLTITEDGLTATHSYKITVEEAFQTKFEVKWETLNVCVENCGFDFKIDKYADINAFRIIEHYNQLIEVKRIDVVYTNDKVANNIYVSGMKDYSRYGYNEDLGRNVYYDPEHDAYLQNGNKGATVAANHTDVKYVDVTYERTGNGEYETGKFKIRFERQADDTFKAISEEKING